MSPELDLLTQGLAVHGVYRVHGGDIAVAYRLDTADGLVFAKTHPRPTPDLFAREAAGLRALREHAPDGLRVPRVLRQSPHGLLLEWIEEGGRRTTTTETAFGRDLARLHRSTTDAGFGGLAGDVSGYLGSVPVDLTPSTDWPSFYLERRVRPLVERAVTQGRLDPGAHDVLTRLAPHARELCGPIEPPALVHGDLWAGNRLIDTHGRNWLIDPACHWGHREYDLAMMQLFGGFGPECFTAYHETYPLAPGWRDRVPWYQLTPLLVHAILFGGGYGDAALHAMTRYA